MLAKYFTSILTFLFGFSPESGDLLTFYCRASTVYNIMLLMFVLTPSFNSSISKEIAVKMRNDIYMATSSQLLHVQQPLLKCSI